MDTTAKQGGLIMATLAQMVGRVVLCRGLGREPGSLEIVDRGGKPHAYVTTDGGERVHVPFAPHAERSADPVIAAEHGVYADHVVLGTKVDRSSGDAVTVRWLVAREVQS